MKIAITWVGAAFLGAVTAALDNGWFKDGKLNPAGAFINILGIVLIMLLAQLIPSKKDR